MIFINTNQIFCVTIISTFIQCGIIKIVEEPFSFNNPNAGSIRRGDQTSEEVLITRVKPQRLSGPYYLIENLAGKCFSNVLNNYKYEFCPFANVTQREQSYKWNAFRGVLGVWKEWNIENNTFKYMHMVHGDMCAGSLDREIKVNITCGEVNSILHVKEPSMCRYEMTFQTPFACPEDIFYVYPMLTSEGQARWNNIEQAYADNEITFKGYSNKRKNLFIYEGLLVDDVLESERKNQPTVSDVENNLTTIASNITSFESNAQCMKAYQELSSEVTRLRIIIANLTAKLISNNLTNNETINFAN
uniref:N-acetylglucosamine-1-phosphotransferase subunit gamma n=1 Tax=Hydra vulgaris TaxID=6087 RepID=T2M350_HYDVU